MLELDPVDIEHISYLVHYCLAHQNCSKTCGDAMSCEDLGRRLLDAANRLIKGVQTSLSLDELDLLLILFLRNYCRSCQRCSIRCTRKLWCESLMWKIVFDHKERYVGNLSDTKQV